MKTIKCQALDDNGCRCRRSDVQTRKYYGDSKGYRYLTGEPDWVIVYLCSKHRKPRDSKRKSL